MIPDKNIRTLIDILIQKTVDAATSAHAMPTKDYVELCIANHRRTLENAIFVLTQLSFFYRPPLLDAKLLESVMDHDPFGPLDDHSVFGVAMNDAKKYKMTSCLHTAVEELAKVVKTLLKSNENKPQA